MKTPAPFVIRPALLLSLLVALAACSDSSEQTDPVAPSTDTETGTTDPSATPGDSTQPSSDEPTPEPIEVVVEEGCNPLAVTTECVFPMPSRFFERADAESPTGVR